MIDVLSFLFGMIAIGVPAYRWGRKDGWNAYHRAVLDTALAHDQYKVAAPGGIEREP